MSNYPVVTISDEMIDAAQKLVDAVRVNRTVASSIDTLTGILGEFVFAQYFYSDWRKNRVGSNKGDVNFTDIEIKTSAFPFSPRLNLLVREDYAKKRKAPFYVQIIISVQDRKASSINPGTLAYVCGYATAEEVDNAPLKDMGSKFGGYGGYKCHHIEIPDLSQMDGFHEAYKSYQRRKNGGQ